VINLCLAVEKLIIFFAGTTLGLAASLVSRPSRAEARAVSRGRSRRGGSSPGRRRSGGWPAAYQLAGSTYARVQTVTLSMTALVKAECMRSTCSAEAPLAPR
jgi:hypothetical protein